jgi:methyltransferase (TIGR00027 family)
MRLVHDPYGLRFGGPATVALAKAAVKLPLAVGRMPVVRTVMWVQIRTRVLDDVLRAFTAAGGQQVLLLGAGFDCRGTRFADELGDGTVFEVDHPATQARKKRVLAEAAARQARTRYLAWDFERDRMIDLPERLALLGHDSSRPTLTIWEGVTPYLTPTAIASTVASVHALSAPGSPFAFTYFDRAQIDRPDVRHRVLARFVARVGEPFRFGWDPTELPMWLDDHGFALDWDRTDLELAARLLPEHGHYMRHGGFRHIALASRSSES